ncbi:hypothetical protein CFIMG_008545RA00001 [Ceratocystis fimbriata CBS 114723]|uniref:Uncharacterized protein n=1 Tax=Ceratocystis fimbriata CBS 114723 TaxID=1035309 RepID=A0A2C5X1M8_9PEZI|nr:hypothetical protein CFIMG_008545RA00001 [Ceratocystis fimbriata CBS 114723]
MVPTKTTMALQVSFCLVPLPTHLPTGSRMARGLSTRSTQTTYDGLQNPRVKLKLMNMIYRL